MLLRVQLPKKLSSNSSQIALEWCSLVPGVRDTIITAVSDAKAIAKDQELKVTGEHLLEYNIRLDH